MNNSIQQRYLFAQQLAKEAGGIALDFYRNRDSLQIECKQGEKLDLVSVADKTVEAHIKSALKQHFPQDGFLGEESGADHIEKEFIWIIDPIDGTNPFLYGLHAWCISIAVMHQGKVVVGAIFDPVHSELFHAMQGQGAFVNSQPIHTALCASVQDGLTGLGMSHRVKPDFFVPVLEKLLLDGGIFVRCGSGALTLAQVAAGRLIGYFEPHINAWDVAAGILLIQEAGGLTNDFFANDGLLKGNYILAAGSQAVFNQLDQYHLYH